MPAIGTELLVNIFEVLDKNNSKEKITRRLYCESGHPATKGYRFVNDSTKARLDKIIPKCPDCRHDKLRHATIVLAFEELAKLKELQLLKGMYLQLGGPAKEAYKLCNARTQRAIDRLGLHQGTNNQ